MLDITIPPEALEAAKEAIRPLRHNPYITSDEVAYAAILAALENWPMKQYRAWDDVQGVGTFIILPLTGEHRC